MPLKCPALQGNRDLLYSSFSDDKENACESLLPERTFGMEHELFNLVCSVYIVHSLTKRDKECFINGLKIELAKAPQLKIIEWCRLEKISKVI